MLVLCLFKMAETQIECSMFQLWSVIKSLMAEKCTSCEIYRRCDLYGEACFNQTNFTNKLKVGLPIQAQVKKTVHIEKKADTPVKKMFRLQQSLKNVKLTVF